MSNDKTQIGGITKNMIFVVTWNVRSTYKEGTQKKELEKYGVKTINANVIQFTGG